MRKVDAPECGTCALRYGAATILDRGSRPQFRKRKTSRRDWSRPSTNRQVDVAFRGPMLSSILTSHKILIARAESFRKYPGLVARCAASAFLSGRISAAVRVASPACTRDDAR